MASFNYEKFCADRLTVINKQARRVPFQLNDVQKRFLSKRGRLNLILKARQQGFSTLLVAMAIIRFLFQENFYGMIIANDADNAIGLLDRAKYFLKSAEESYGAKVPLKYNSRYELHNSENNATILIGTAQNVDVGRSKTIHFLHASEAAFFRDLGRILSSALQAVPETGEVYLESTANGFNEYKKLWDAATLGDNNFVPLFFPASAFYEQEYLNIKKKELGRYFPQEYPETPEEAFLTSGDTYFDKDALKYYLEQVTKWKGEHGSMARVPEI